MHQAVYFQMAASGIAIAFLFVLMAWAKLTKPVGPLDEYRARALIEEAFPGRRIDALWVAASGAGALAKSGGLALVLCRLGDGYTPRRMPWAHALAQSFKDGRLLVNLADVPAPSVVIDLPSWPPKELAA